MYKKKKVNGVGSTRERKGTAEGNKKKWMEGKRIKEKVRRMSQKTQGRTR